MAIRPRYYAVLARLAELNLRGVNPLWNRLQKMRYPNAKRESTSIGRYVIAIEGEQGIRVAIDTSDGRDVRDTDALEWCDVYFKTNLWPSLRYAEKVRPFLNGNGSLSASKLDRLKQLRNAEKSIDLSHCAKIWQPTAVGSDYSPEKWMNVIEHQVRLFETLSRIDCRKELLAIIPTPLREQDVRGFINRLQACGVKCQRDWGDITSQKFWAGLSRAKIAFLRPGNHLCISWRMTDLLAMGACIVCDGAPYPNWYQPLESGVHFGDGHCRLGPDYSLPDDSRYARLQRVIEDLLADEDGMLSLRGYASNYFDRYGNPQAVASYLLETVASIEAN